MVGQLYEVRKAFSGAGTGHSPGDVVDASGWKNVQNLINNRYLIPIESAEAVTNGSLSSVGDKSPSSNKKAPVKTNRRAS